jgi:hypothetical protein
MRVSCIFYCANEYSIILMTMLARILDRRFVFKIGDFMTQEHIIYHIVQIIVHSEGTVKRLLLKVTRAIQRVYTPLDLVLQQPR